MTYVALTSDDLIPDEPLDRIASGAPISDELDSLNHRATAQRVAELALASKGNSNIALFGPWGAGKSSFFGLVSDQLKVADSTVLPLRFDAWKNSGPNFQTNFLSSLAEEIPNADKNISARLFQSTTSVALPFGLKLGDRGSRRRTAFGAGAAMLAIFVAIPALWTWLLVFLDPTLVYLTLLAENLTGWVGFAAGGSLIVLVATILLELSKVTVQESTPSHITQFGALFRELMDTSKKLRYVVFIDELDRCGSLDVIQTLEGLRTFLGHERCVFIVAFDREAVSATITEHLPNNVPTRPSRPYYSTSGEYLDKIFQYQIALPPQPSHTFRRFALALVEGKGGLWAELRTADSRRLERVVRILSPMHVTSPRRTKVLLNDFAINSRILERLDFDWLSRAEEIAALTVLQTEFPNFAADLEQHPQLLRYVATGEIPKRSTLADAAGKYAQGSSAELDGIVRSTRSELTAVEDDAAGDTAAPTEQPVGEGVALKLNENLHRFLRKLGEMGVQLPMPDLILMHSDSNLLSFDDLNVYNALLAASDEPRADTMEAIAPAAQPDRERALRFLLEQVEIETGSQAETLAILAGELAASLPDYARTLADSMQGTWEQVIGSDPTALGRFSTDGIIGFVGAFSTVLGVPRLRAVHALIKLRKPQDQAAALSVSMQNIPVQTVAQHTYLGPSVLALATASPSLAVEFFRLMDRSKSGPLSVKEINALASQFAITPPEEIPPAAATAAAQAVAAQENQEAREEYEAALLRTQEALAQLAEEASALTPKGAARAQLLQVLRLVGKTHPWANDLHDQAIRVLRDRGQDREANDETLTAMADLPNVARTSTLLTTLDRSVPVGAAELRSAIAMSFQVATYIKNARTARTSAAANARSLAALKVDGEFSDVEALIADSRRAFDETWTPADVEASFETAAQLADALSLLPSTRSASLGYTAEVFTKAMASLEEGADCEFLSVWASSLDVDRAQSLLVQFQEEIANSPREQQVALVRTALACQTTILATNRRVRPISGKEIATAVELGLERDDVARWLSSGPKIKEVEASGLELASLSRLVLERYSHVATVRDREGLWKKLWRANGTAEQLKATVSFGVSKEFYSDASKQVMTASNSNERASAVARFRTLPRGKPSVAAATDIAEHLMTPGVGNKSDAPSVAAVLLDAVSGMTSTERRELSGKIEPWVKRVDGYLSKSKIADLRSAQLLPPERSFVERIGDAIGGSRKRR